MSSSTATAALPTRASLWAETRQALYTRALSPLANISAEDPHSPLYSNYELLEFLTQASSTVQNLVLVRDLNTHPWWAAFIRDSSSCFANYRNQPAGIDLLSLIERNVQCLQAIITKGPPGDANFRAWLAMIIGNEPSVTDALQPGSPAIILRANIAALRAENLRVFHKLFNKTDFPGAPFDAIPRILIAIAYDCASYRLGFRTDGANILMTTNPFVPTEPSPFTQTDLPGRGLSAIALTDFQAVGLLLSVFDTFYWVLDGAANGQSGQRKGDARWENVVVDPYCLLHTDSTYPNPSLAVKIGGTAGR